MELSTSTALYGLSPPNQHDASNEDAIHAFRLFLDLVTPAEFSKLLRARVSHLLKTWPPHGETNTSSYSSNISMHSGLPSPTFESVRAFAAFFRAEDAPGPPPIDLSSTTSSAALQHHLVALQTLLSFLSNRELKDIVRARLNEGGRDRFVTVQGLMDIMRNAGSEEEENEWPPSDMIAEEEGIPNSQEPATMGPDARAVTAGRTPWTQNGSKRKELVECQGETRSHVLGDGQPPKKRQRIEASESAPADGNSASPGMLTQPESTSQPLSHLQESSPTRLTHPCLPPLNLSNPTGHVFKVNARDRPLPTCQSHGLDRESRSEPDRHAPGSRSDPDSNPEKPGDAELNDAGMEISARRSVGSKENFDDSDEEDEGGGLVVTLLDDETATTTSVVSRPPEAPSVTVQGLPSPPDSAPTAAGISPLTATAEQEPVSPAFSSFVGMSRAESNRRRMRAALGLPPKEPEHSEVSTLSMNPGHEIAKGVVGEQPQGLRHILNAVPTPARDPAITSPPSSPFNLRLCTAERRVSRAPSPSFDDYDSDDDRASPPGPVLRAVDWASGVTSVPTDTVMDVDDIEAEDASDDTLAFNPGLDADCVLKPTAAYTRNPDQQVQAIAWPHDGGTTTELVDDGEETSEMTEQPQKLFIRLPARQRASASTTGTEASPSPPPAASPSRGGATCEIRQTKANEDGLTDTARVLESADIPTPDGTESQIQHTPPTTGEPPTPTRMKIQPLANEGLSQPVPSATPHSTPAPPSESQSQSPSQSQSQPQSQSQTQPQPLPISRTQSASPGTPQHGAHSLNPQPTPAGAFPGPWFGAMIYVPYTGHSPYTGHHAPAMLAPPKPVTGPGVGLLMSPAGAPGGDQAEAGVPASTPREPGPWAKRGKLLEENDDPPPVELDPDMTYTDDVGVKEGPSTKRRCFNCGGVQAPSWRKSKLNEGKILCNKCGIYESTHMTARPLKTRPRRSVGDCPTRKRPKKRE